jgi:hypothetical protein
MHVLIALTDTGFRILIPTYQTPSTPSYHPASIHPPYVHACDISTPITASHHDTYTISAMDSLPNYITPCIAAQTPPPRSFLPSYERSRTRIHRLPVLASLTLPSLPLDSLHPSLFFAAIGLRSRRCRIYTWTDLDWDSYSDLIGYTYGPPWPVVISQHVLLCFSFAFYSRIHTSYILRT